MDKLALKSWQKFDCKFFIVSKNSSLWSNRIFRPNLEILYIYFSMFDVYSPGCLLSESAGWTLVNYNGFFFKWVKSKMAASGHFENKLTKNLIITIM